MFEHGTLLLICLLFGISFLCVAIGLLRAPSDERLDPCEQTLMDQAKNTADQDERRSDLQFPRTQPHRPTQQFPPGPHSRSYFAS